MELSSTVAVADVKDVVLQTLGVEDRADAIDADTPLFGTLPELDSMAVLELVLELEQRFGIVLEGEDVTAETFETLANLTAVVEGKLR